MSCSRGFEEARQPSHAQAGSSQASKPMKKGVPVHEPYLPAPGANRSIHNGADRQIPVRCTRNIVVSSPVAVQRFCQATRRKTPSVEIDDESTGSTTPLGAIGEPLRARLARPGRLHCVAAPLWRR